jgi:lipopolysaccharide heptosyltransferase II
MRSPDASVAPPRGWARAWARARRLLCVRLDAIGDVLMTTPALRALRHSVPGRRLTLLTSPGGAEAARLVPEVDDVIVYEAPWMKAAAPRVNGRAEAAMADRLREEAFDGAVIFTVYSQSPLPAALLCYLSGVPLRLAHCRENPYRLLTHWVPDPEPTRMVRHEARRQLDLAATIGARTNDERLSLRIPDGAALRVSVLLARLRLDHRAPWAVVHPGATAPSRRYPENAFARVVRRLVHDLGWSVVLTGTKSERPLVRRIVTAAGVPARSLAGHLSLGDLGALLSCAPILIANNTGPVHVAAAVGTPVVVLYALTNPQHTPWGVLSRVLFHDVPCRFCYKSICPEGHHRCLRLVSPEAIVRAADELYRETRSAARQPAARDGSGVTHLPGPSVTTRALVPSIPGDGLAARGLPG